MKIEPQRLDFLFKERIIKGLTLCTHALALQARRECRATCE